MSFLPINQSQYKEQLLSRKHPIHPILILHHYFSLYLSPFSHSLLSVNIHQSKGDYDSYLIIIRIIINCCCCNSPINKIALHSSKSNSFSQLSSESSLTVVVAPFWSFPATPAFCPPTFLPLAFPPLTFLLPCC